MLQIPDSAEAHYCRSAPERSQCASSSLGLHKHRNNCNDRQQRESPCTLWTIDCCGASLLATAVAGCDLLCCQIQQQQAGTVVNKNSAVLAGSPGRCLCWLLAVAEQTTAKTFLPLGEHTVHECPFLPIQQVLDACDLVSANVVSNVVQASALQHDFWPVMPTLPQVLVLYWTFNPMYQWPGTVAVRVLLLAMPVSVWVVLHCLTWRKMKHVLRLFRYAHH